MSCRQLIDIAVHERSIKPDIARPSRWRKRRAGARRGFAACRQRIAATSWRFQDRDSLSFRDGVALGDKQLGDFPFRGRHHGDLHLHDLDEYDRLVASNMLSFAALDSANNARGLGFYAYFGHRRPLWRG